VDAGVEVLTLGQYLRPSLKHLPIVRYYEPQEFESLKADALSLGFRHVESGPLVRSSYHAERQISGIRPRAYIPGGTIPLCEGKKR